MKDKNIYDLISRYEQMLVSGKSVYFDASEYDELAEYYDSLDDYETANEIVEIGLTIHPANEQLMLKHARFLTYDAKYEEALAYINMHLSSADDTELYLLKIECTLQLGNSAEALNIANKLLSDTESDLDEVLAELGFVYLDAEDYTTAILFLQKSLEYNPENKDVLSDLIYAYESQNDFASAIKSCNALLDIDPYSFETWTMLGRLYFMSNDIQHAIESLDFALSINDSDIPTLKMKAHCLLLTDRVTDAIEILEQSCQLSPNDEMLYMSLADCYFQLEKFETMLTYIQKHEDLAGETPISLAKKAYIYLRNNKIDTAREAISKALELDPSSYDVNMIAGDLFFEATMPNEAEKYYKTAMDLVDYKEEAMEKLTTIYINNRDFDKAISLQKEILKTAPSPLVYEKLALLYMEVGDKDKFEACINNFDEQLLQSFFLLLFPEYQEKMSTIDKVYIRSRLNEAFDSRLLYKNSKY